MRADLLRRPAAPLAKRVRGGTHHYSRYSSFRGRERSLDPRKLRRAFRHSRTNSALPKGLRQPSAFWSDLRRGKVRLAFCLHVPRQGSAQVCKSFSEPVALQIRHTQTPVACTLDADLSADHRPCTSPEQSGEGSLQCQPTCLRQGKYSQSGKGSRGRRTRRTPPPCPSRTTSLKARFPP